ncbi:hypothetical protein [Lysinibacillus sp. HST-98]|uniref:hypothetical protein n=1 Tax=Lysinibacillus sp. HST-98 TaxID=2800419 RepID=UPI001F3D8929|nr:hypothetical protein [Lysinibacillus sp. HST-98]
MKASQQLVTSNLEEKMKLFTQAVSGQIIEEAHFVIANTNIPTDTFNLLVVKSPMIHKEIILNKGSIISLLINFLSARGWMPTI